MVSKTGKGYEIPGLALSEILLKHAHLVVTVLQVVRDQHR